MTKEEHDGFMAECRESLATASGEHMEGVYYTLLRRSEDVASRFVRDCGAYGLPALTDDAKTYGRVLVGAAVALGWPGPTWKEDAGEDGE